MTINYFGSTINRKNSTDLDNLTKFIFLIINFICSGYGRGSENYNVWVTVINGYELFRIFFLGAFFPRGTWLKILELLNIVLR